jgi:hypothetical protein
MSDTDAHECSTCHALVAPESEELHYRWHRLLSQSLDETRALALEALGELDQP